jgi:hypothetical protein
VDTRIEDQEMDVEAGVLPLFKLPDVSLDATQKRIAFDVSNQSISMFAEVVNRDVVTVFDLVVQSEEEYEVARPLLIHRHL